MASNPDRRRVEREARLRWEEQERRHKARLAQLEQQEQVADALIEQLSRFPVKPRGKMPGLDLQQARAQTHIGRLKRAGASPAAAMSRAAARLERITARHFYDSPAPRARSTVKKSARDLPPFFVYGIDDAARIEAITLRMAQVAGLGLRGVGNRTNYGRLSAMVHALLAIEQRGMILPTPSVIDARHLSCPEFVRVLEQQRIRLRAGFADVDTMLRANKADLRRLAKVAAHRIGQALAVLGLPAKTLSK